MEGKGFKSVIMCVVILGLVVEHNQVDCKSCCPNTTARNCYNVCRFTGSQVFCANLCGCIHVDGTTCPPDYPKFNNFPHYEEAIVSDYCKLGCTSSVCDAINTDAGNEEVKGAVEHCNNACSRLCTKGLEIAKLTA